MFACGHQRSRPFAEPDLRLPADGLDRFGELFSAPLQMTTEVGGIPVRPGPFNQGTTRMGMPWLGDAAVLTTCPTGIFRRRQPQIMHELSGLLEARAVSQCGHHGHRDREVDAPEGLERLDDGLEAPGWHRLLKCVFETLEAVGWCGHRLDLFLNDHGLRWGRTDHLAEPTPVGRAPMSSPRLADIVPEPEGFEAQLGRLQLTERIFTRPAHVTDRFIGDRGDIDRGEVP
jgi:hypothetical protein